MNSSLPANASVGHRWLYRQLMSGPQRFDKLRSLAKEHGLGEAELMRAGLEAEVFRFPEEGTNALLWDLFPGHMRAKPVTKLGPTPAAAAPTTPTPTPPKPTVAVPKPAVVAPPPPAYSDIETRRRAQSLLWQDCIQGREQAALLLITSRGIGINEMPSVLEKIPREAGGTSSQARKRISAVIWHRDVKGRDNLAVHLLRRPELSAAEILGILRAAPSSLSPTEEGFR